MIEISQQELAAVEGGIAPLVLAALGQLASGLLSGVVIGVVGSLLWGRNS